MGAGGIGEISVPSLQFCCELKTALEKKKKKALYNERYGFGGLPLRDLESGKPKLFPWSVRSKRIWFQIDEMFEKCNFNINNIREEEQRRTSEETSYPYREHSI